jgi:hypothetical protein
MNPLLQLMGGIQGQSPGGVTSQPQQQQGKPTGYRNPLVQAMLGVQATPQLYQFTGGSQGY